jgi:hypothetical protein
VWGGVLHRYVWGERQVGDEADARTVEEGEGEGRKEEGSGSNC